MTDITNNGSATEDSPTVPQFERSVDHFGINVDRKAFLKLLIKNKIFTILTLSIYRFWAKTKVRQFLWNSFSIGGDRFEYHGTAKELFIGFLIVMVILLPLFTIVNFTQSMIPLENIPMQLAGSFLNIFLLFCFWQFARYRLWRYRLSRTSWRGIRFFLIGRATTYLGITLFWSFLSMLTLGWAMPWMKAAQLKYQIGNTCFGDRNFNFQGTAKGIFRIFWLPTLISQLSFLPLIVVMATGGLEQLSTDLEVIDPMLGLTIAGLYFVAFLVSLIAVLFYKAREISYVLSCLSFGTAQFTSKMKARSLFRIVIIAVLAFIGMGLAVGAIYFLAVLILPVFAPVMIIVSVFLGLLILDIFKFFFILLPIAKEVSETTTISGFAAFEDAAQNAEESPKYGEGLADSLDVGAF